MERLKAVVLAAGMGIRLRPLTYITPKCLIEVKGKPILENALEHLNRNGIKAVIIVTGHLGRRVRKYFGNQFHDIRLVYVENTRFKETNNIYSLWLAREHLNDDILLLEGDVFFEGEVIDRVCKCKYPDVMVIDGYRDFMNGTGINTKRDIVTEIILNKGEHQDVHHKAKLKTVNIYKFSKGFLETHFIPALDKCIMDNYHGEFYEFALARIIKSKAVQLRALSITGLRWFEVDTPEDWQKAQQLFG